MTSISAQVSLYPLRQAHLAPAIARARSGHERGHDEHDSER
jgi:hypothetical protein